MGQEEASSSSKSIALTCDEHKKMKGNKQVEISSSSSKEEEDDDEASTSSSSNDEEVMHLIEGVKRMLRKMRAKGVPITIEDIMFTDQRRRQRKNGCFGCGRKGHFVEDC
jgi:hypothetical protein